VRRDGDSGTVSLSWSRAEELVNRLREERRQPELTLAQTGGEGEVSHDVAAELDRLGWTWQPLNTDRHDERHIDRPESPPPPDAGERRAPVSGSDEWERRAHDEASAARRGAPNAPVQSGPGEGAGGGEAPRVGGG
jgi:hypothetical protein